MNYHLLLGTFRPRSTITLGARGDSYYEYLLKQWVQVSKTQSFPRQRLRRCHGRGNYSKLIVNYIIRVNWANFVQVTKHLIRKTVPNQLLFIGELPQQGSTTFKPKMDELVSLRYQLVIMRGEFIIYRPAFSLVHLFLDITTGCPIPIWNLPRTWLTPVTWLLPGNPRRCRRKSIISITKRAPTRTFMWNRTMPIICWGRRPSRVFTTSTIFLGTRHIKIGAGKSFRYFGVICDIHDTTIISYWLWEWYFENQC